MHHDSLNGFSTVQASYLLNYLLNFDIYFVTAKVLPLFRENNIRVIVYSSIGYLFHCHSQTFG